MGATNVATAFALYAGKIPHISMNVLAYVCLVSRDDDKSPWFGQGHAALADAALGRPRPITSADLRAVSRAIQPLLELGVLEVDRRPAPRPRGQSHRTVRYRLNLGHRLALFNRDGSIDEGG